LLVENTSKLNIYLLRSAKGDPPVAGYAPAFGHLVVKIFNENFYKSFICKWIQQLRGYFKDEQK